MTAPATGYVAAMSIVVEPGPLVIAGAGGLGRECVDIVDAINIDASTASDRIDLVGFLDDGPVDRELLDALGLALLGPTTDIEPEWRRYVAAVGDGSIRRIIAERLDRSGLTATTLIHPSATLGRLSTLGRGSLMCAGARVTSNVSIGHSVQVHVNAAVGHDSVLDDFVSVYPGATVSGNCVIGAGTTIGTGANVLPGVTIGVDAYVGAGAVVVNDVADRTVVVGVPAAPLRSPETT